MLYIGYYCNKYKIMFIEKCEIFMYMYLCSYKCNWSC